MLGIEPGKRLVGCKGGLPDEAAVGLKVHAEERVGLGGEIVVVDAAVDKRRGHVERAHVLLDLELWLPHGQGLPVTAEGGVVGHAAVDVVLDAGALRCVGEGAAGLVLVAPVRRVDKGQLGAGEEAGDEALVGQFADDELDVGQGRELLSHETLAVSHLGAHMPADGGGDADEAGRLAATAVDGDDQRALFRGHA